MHPVHAVRAGQRLPRAVGRGQRARVRRDQGLGLLRQAHAEQDDRYVGGQGGGQRRAQPGGVPDRLQDQGQDPGLGQPQRVPGVGRGGGDELLPGRDGQAEAEPAARAQQRREHRPGVRDQGDRPGRHRVGLEVPHRAQAAGHVHEPHASGPAHGHARVRGDRGQPVPQPRPAVSVEGVSEDNGRTDLGACGQDQLILQRGVGHREQDQIHGFGHLGQVRQAGHAADLGVAGVDQVGARRGRAAGHLGDHPGAEAAGARAGADQGDAARLQHGGHRGNRGGYCHRRRTRLRRSAIAARAACMPGMPHTPPPAWVAELA